MDPHFEKDYQYHQVIAKEYDSIVVAPRLVTNNLLYKKFRSLVKPGEKMLDLACGTGHMTFRFGKLFEEVVAVDHSDAMLSQAKEKAAQFRIQNIQFLKADVFEFLNQAHSESFDLITCTGFLHHLLPQQIPGVTKSLYRIMKKSGLLIVSEPVQSTNQYPEMVSKWNRNSIAAKLQYSTLAEEPDEEPIEAEFLASSLRDAGFQIELTHRNWEIFPHHIPPSPMDRIAIPFLNAVYGKKGNVFTLGCRKG